jgi:hypothetical protein
MILRSHNWSQEFLKLMVWFEKGSVGIPGNFRGQGVRGARLVVGDFFWELGVRVPGIYSVSKILMLILIFSRF